MPIYSKDLEIGQTQVGPFPCGGGLITAIELEDDTFTGDTLALSNDSSAILVKSEAGAARSITVTGGECCIQIDPPVRAPALILTANTAQLAADCPIRVHTT